MPKKFGIGEIHELLHKCAFLIWGGEKGNSWTNYNILDYQNKLYFKKESYQNKLNKIYWTHIEHNIIIWNLKKTGNLQLCWLNII